MELGEVTVPVGMSSRTIRGGEAPEALPPFSCPPAPAHTFRPPGIAIPGTACFGVPAIVPSSNTTLMASCGDLGFMSGRRRGYKVLMTITGVFTAAAVATALPNPAAGRECLLNYRALCAFTPVSTLLLLMVAALACLVRSREFR